MRRLILTLAAVAAALPLVACMPMSERVVRAEMARCPQASQLDGLQGKLKWNYTTGLELKAMLDVYERCGDSAILEYVDAWYDSIIGEDGTIGANYKMSGYVLDHICPVRTLFDLYRLTGREKYRKAMDVAFAQLREQPRTVEGGFWHKAVYPHQMWLDGLYMAEPFYAQYVEQYAPDSLKAGCFKDIMDQFIIVADHCYDPATGLYRHAWDSSHEMFWCDPATGQSAHAWGRALGWYCMAIVETLPFVPEGTPGRDEVLAIFRGIYDRLPDYADKSTGMWYQVLDRPGQEGNYVESTASAMFTYAMLKGVRLGYLDKGLKIRARSTYRQLLKTFVRTDEAGMPELVQCCAVAGLGGKEMRSGTYEYYIGEKIVSNDCKGIGPLVWASIEMER